MQRKESTSNHARAPKCAAFVEAMRKAFGRDQVSVLWVKEGDFELGTAPGPRKDAQVIRGAEQGNDTRKDDG